MKNLNVILMTLAMLVFAACSSETGVAGTLIETNTGNKVLIETNTGNGFARVMISIAELGVSEGDTLQLSRTERDTVGDTIFVTGYYTEDVVNGVDVALGFVAMDSVPVGSYDSLTVVPLEGDARTLPVDLSVEEGGIYRVDEGGSVAVEPIRVSIRLPEGFEDLADADEVFENIPFVVSLDEKIKNPCLVDGMGMLISLDVSAGPTFGEKASSGVKKYWGQMPQVIFSDSGSIEFDVLDGCQASDSLGLLLGRHVEHFDYSVPSDSAAASLEKMDTHLGGALWTAASDRWYYINDFKPFVDDYNMSASLWINMKADQQAETYIRILSAKKDSVGFIVQQRGDRSGINLRVDAGADNYNQVFGAAEVLDGTWHNYSFRMNKDCVAVFLDGVLVQEAALKSGAGFATAYNPAVGGDKPNLVGGVDEIFFFDGSQSNNWMRLFYALQK